MAYGIRYAMGITRVFGSEAKKLESQDFELGLLRKVIGQQEAVQAIANLYQVFRAGLNSPGRPVGNLLFLGPTGTGRCVSSNAVGRSRFDVT